MGIKNIFRNSLSIFKGKPSTDKMVPRHRVVNLFDILSNLKNFNTVLTTPKSRVNIVYNFGEYVDLALSFCRMEKSNCIVSKGLATQLHRKRISVKEWQRLDSVSASQLDNVKIICSNEKFPVFLLESGRECHHVLDKFLELINKWATDNYPLVIGIDVFSQDDLDISAINLLSTVLKYDAIKYVFYNRGIRNIDFLNIPSQINELLVECPLGFFDGRTNYEKYLNTMIELRNLLEQADIENSKIYKRILSDVIEDTGGAAMDDIVRRGMNVFDNILKRFLFKTNIKYRMGFCLEKGGLYVEYNSVENKFFTTERYILVTRDTELMLSGELVSKINRINITDCKMPNIKWIEGVPGCGKTRYIVTEHTPGRDLILSQTRAGIKDVREGVMQAKTKNKSSLKLFVDYRTVASYIINCTNKIYDRVFIDEGLMMHAGYIGFIAKLSGASEIVVVGDSKQVPYIERSPIKTIWYKISDFCEPAKYLTITQRCPIDVCYAISDHYENIATLNRNVISIKSVAGEREFHQLEPDTLVLTYTQKEKQILTETLHKYKKIRIHTIHEAQGLTSKRVVLVRIDSREKNIYNSVPHAIVALTRHTESFKYLTTGEEDSVRKFIRRLDYISDEGLRQWNSKRLENETMEINSDKLWLA